MDVVHGRSGSLAAPVLGDLGGEFGAGVGSGVSGVSVDSGNAARVLKVSLVERW